MLQITVKDGRVSVDSTEDMDGEQMAEALMLAATGLLGHVDLVGQHCDFTPRQCRALQREVIREGWRQFHANGAKQGLVRSVATWLRCWWLVRRATR